MSFRPSGFSCLTPKLLVLSVAILLGFGTTAAWSQATSTAALAGLVTDEQNAAIPGAEVRLVDATIGGIQTTLTNESGRYVIANVAPGTYAITVSNKASRFSKSARRRSTSARR